MMEVRCRKTAQLVLVGKLVWDIAECATDAIIGPAEYFLQPANLGDPEARSAVHSGVVLDLLDIEAEPIVEPNNKSGIVLPPVAVFASITVVEVGVSLN